MVILVLGAYPNIDLEVRRSFRRQLSKVRNLDDFEKFDSGQGFLISGSYFDSGSWSRFVMSIMTCVQDLKSIGLDLLGFGIECRSLKF